MPRVNVTNHFYCGGDTEQMDRVFRQSRPKFRIFRRDGSARAFINALNRLKKKKEDA